MKLNKTAFLIFLLFLLTSCGGKSSDSPSGSGVSITVTGDNALPLTVNGSLCTINPYINEPCVSVTVCSPGTATCQTINDILLDSGDIGLRVFNQALNPVIKASLTPVTASNGDPIADCVQYADGSSDWGPVKIADVVLGKEPTIQQVPIQVIDSAFATPPSPCSSPNSTLNQNPANAGFNGSLGVGFWLQDCGSYCVNTLNNKQYYTCNGSNCSQATVSLTDQVQNPVALLPPDINNNNKQDNNGVMVVLPSVPSSGALYANGALVLGIDTRTNNTPSGVQLYDADSSGNFVTKFNNIFYSSSFIDSGSNGLFFPGGGQFPNCSSFPEWYCPASAKDLVALVNGASGLPNPSTQVPFQIGNVISLINSSPNFVFANIGGSAPQFDWGLPFFLGRTVFIGFEGQTSSLGTGPYWAF
jgi:hypothetical protein